ncbi:MAG TPA: NAD(P)/FAD-dependent oxidoreductase [Acidobacteriota bacterium]|nr:NAD(P)/FAD-dependent oxidoreductase [Acidobacteriota bacterium]
MSLKSARVLIVGAGPVGLVTALLLNEQGLDVEIVDEQWRGTTRSYGLALHASSLELLDSIGVAEELVQTGIPCRHLSFCDASGPRCEIDFGLLDGPFPFVLILPQSVLEKRLEKELKDRGVNVRWNHRVETVEQANGVVTTQIDRLTKESFGYSISHTEWIVEETFDFKSEFLIGADGHRSAVRRALGTQFISRGDPSVFAIFEFSGFPLQKRPCRIHTLLTESGDGSLWPVKDGQFRWSFEIPFASEAEERQKERLFVQFRDRAFPHVDGTELEKLISERAPWSEISVGEIAWSAMVQFEKRLVDRFGRNRVWLIGDAAHLFGPLGTQSMNVGFLEGADLSRAIATHVQSGGSGELNSFSEQLEENLRDRWETIFGLRERVRASTSTNDWVRQHAGQIATAIPATGPHLSSLLPQAGLSLQQFSHSSSA